MPVPCFFQNVLHRPTSSSEAKSFDEEMILMANRSILLDCIIKDDGTKVRCGSHDRRSAPVEQEGVNSLPASHLDGSRANIAGHVAGRTRSLAGLAFVWSLKVLRVTHTRFS